MKLIAVVLLILHSSIACCCETNDWSKYEWLQNSCSVYYGRIVSIALDGTYAAENLPNPMDNSLNELRQLSIVTDRIIEVLVLKTVKGKNQKTIKAEISWCGGGETGFLDYVTIYNFDGFWHVIPDVESEKSDLLDPLVKPHQ